MYLTVSKGKFSFKIANLSLPDYWINRVQFNYVIFPVILSYT